MIESSEQSFYDPLKTYEQNYKEGPFGAFVEPMNLFVQTEEPQYAFLGELVNFPFGIPAGPLLNGKFANAALDLGFDIVTYKTVRSREFPVNGHPNVLPIKVSGDLTLEMAQNGVTAATEYKRPLTITNSFGVPSFPPDVWQPDLASTVSHAQEGQLVIGSFQGTTTGSTEDYIRDFANIARLVKETGVKVLEVNLSCPNEGSSHLLCFDIPRTKAVTSAIKDEIGDTPLIIKIAFFDDKEQLKKLVQEVGSLVEGIESINTIPAKIYKDEEHTQFALGVNRPTSGTCGIGIKWAGLESTKKLRDLRSELGLSFAIIGVGGVDGVESYQDYRDAGADAVMSATGAMWNPYLAQEIKKELQTKKS